MENASNGSKKLWRYMPLISLVDFLQTKELRLPRADLFEDIQEGFIGLDALLETIPPKLFPQAKEAVEKLNRQSFVSCWHLSSSESLAMWKVYGGHAYSVALVSSIGKVSSICHDYCKDLSAAGMFGEVIYENYVSNEVLNVATMGIPFGYGELPISSATQVLFMKAKAFSYEQEWRLVIRKSSEDAPAIRVPAPNLNEFIEAIYISPEAPEWMVLAIKRLVSQQFGLANIPVTKSPLSKHFGN